MKRLLSVLAALFFFLPIVWAQADTLRLGYTVRGTVVDAFSGKALSSVHVAVPDRHYATVTNADGVFVIKSNAPIGTLVFSYMGYRTQYQRTGNGDMKVRLSPEAIDLNAATVIGADPEEVVRSAVYRIQENYSATPQLLECFYRETIQKGSRYTSVSEAVARLYKNGYREGFRPDRAALEKSRILMSQRKRDTLSVNVQGGPTVALSFDVVKNRGLLFDAEELKLYRFQMETPAYIDDRLQFVISLHPVSVSAVDYALYHGTLYIDTETLAFSRIELSLDMSDKAKATRAMLIKKPFTLRFNPRELSFLMTYRPQEDGRYRMSYFRSTIRFGCDWRRRLFQTNYTAVNELVVTDVREPVVPITRQEMFRTTDYLTQKAAEFQDPDFWSDYNIIEPSESLEHAIDRLRKRR